jgi:hypothetical protein
MDKVEIAKGDTELLKQLERLDDEQLELAQQVLLSKTMGTYGLARMLEYAGDAEITSVLKEACR